MRNADVFLNDNWPAGERGNRLVCRAADTTTTAGSFVAEWGAATGYGAPLRPEKRLAFFARVAHTTSDVVVLADWS